jgi:hypothetical protein
MTNKTGGLETNGAARQSSEPQNALRHDRSARRVVKPAHWLLLRNPDHLKVGQRIRLEAGDGSPTKPHPALIQFAQRLSGYRRDIVSRVR